MRCVYQSGTLHKFSNLGISLSVTTDISHNTCFGHNYQNPSFAKIWHHLKKRSSNYCCNYVLPQASTWHGLQQMLLNWIELSKSKISNFPECNFKGSLRLWEFKVIYTKNYWIIMVWPQAKFLECFPILSGAISNIHFLWFIFCFHFCYIY